MGSDGTMGDGRSLSLMLSLGQNTGGGGATKKRPIPSGVGNGLPSRKQKSMASSVDTKKTFEGAGSGNDGSRVGETGVSMSIALPVERSDDLDAFTPFSPFTPLSDFLSLDGDGNATSVAARSGSMNSTWPTGGGGGFTSIPIDNVGGDMRRSYLRGPSATVSNMGGPMAGLPLSRLPSLSGGFIDDSTALSRNNSLETWNIYGLLGDMAAGAGAVGGGPRAGSGGTNGRTTHMVTQTLIADDLGRDALTGIGEHGALMSRKPSTGGEGDPSSDGSGRGAAIDILATATVLTTMVEGATGSGEVSNASIQSEVKCMLLEHLSSSFVCVRP